VYFLRRVFEDPYVEDLSPEYVHHDSDILWLDPELIGSRSSICARLLGSLGDKPDPDEVTSLVEVYRGRFALDFAYEPWAEAYRESLHAAFLEVVERSITADTDTGHYDRGIRVARAALSVDPDADQIEASLLRLYRLTGAHSAAGEQYAHYAAALRRDLGVEPPVLEDV
jgi:two-component SAPR family response regulator